MTKAIYTTTICNSRKPSLSLSVSLTALFSRFELSVSNSREAIRRDGLLSCISESIASKALTPLYVTVLLL